MVEERREGAIKEKGSTMSYVCEPISGGSIFGARTMTSACPSPVPTSRPPSAALAKVNAVPTPVTGGTDRLLPFRARLGHGAESDQRPGVGGRGVMRGLGWGVFLHFTFVLTAEIPWWRRDPCMPMITS
jgi:hypothetical protein